MSLQAAQMLSMPSIDELLSLPPLQDPYGTSTSVLSDRPSPLEPRPDEPVNREARSKKTVLSSRQKALAEAQPLGSGENADLESIIEAEATERNERPKGPVAPDPEQARKKAKLRHNEQIADFVQLPKLQTTKPKEEKRRPFRPIAVLNQLNEPPPSAGLLPPITPGGTHRSDGTAKDAKGSEVSIRGKSSVSSPVPKDNSQSPSQTNGSRPKKKKVFLRERTKWTEEEAEQLVKGVAIYGMGRWKSILDHPEFDFQPGRTHVDLKDKFRVLFPPKAPHKWVRPMPEPVQSNGQDADATGSSPSNSRSSEKKYPSKTRPKKRVWSDLEDEALDAGFRRYGYKWELMVKDPDLQFDNRTGSQIRDRFRLRYPQHYSQQSNDTGSSDTPTPSDRAAVPVAQMTNHPNPQPYRLESKVLEVQESHKGLATRANRKKREDASNRIEHEVGPSVFDRNLSSPVQQHKQRISASKHSTSAALSSPSSTTTTTTNTNTVVGLDWPQAFPNSHHTLTMPPHASSLYHHHLTPLHHSSQPHNHQNHYNHHNHPLDNTILTDLLSATASATASASATSPPEPVRIPSSTLPPFTGLGTEEWPDPATAATTTTTATGSAPASSAPTLPPLNWEDLVPPSSMFDIS